MDRKLEKPLDKLAKCASSKKPKVPWSRTKLSDTIIDHLTISEYIAFTADVEFKNIDLIQIFDIP